MSWLFSRALVEAYSGDTSSGGERCAQLNVMPSPHPFWRNDRTIDASSLSRFGPTCAVLTAERGAGVLTSYLAAFPVRTSALPAKATGSTASEAGSGANSGASLAKWDRDTCSWKTPQLLLLEEGCESLETLPPWGSTAGGELFQQPTPSGLLELRASITSESGCGLPARAPTPTAGDAKSSGSRNLEGSKAHPGVSLTDFVRPDRTPRVPTPLSSDSRSPGFDAGRQGSQSLSVVVRVPTPTATEYGNNQSPSAGAAVRPSLAALVKRVPTPLASEARQGFQDRTRGMKGKQQSLSTVVQRVPTPLSRDWKSSHASEATKEKNSRPLNEEVGGPLNPTWVEWLMGWPIGWTDLNAPATGRFQEWCASHGRS
jgi:hypothetical protein